MDLTVALTQLSALLSMTVSVLQLRTSKDQAAPELLDLYKENAGEAQQRYLNDPEFEGAILSLMVIPEYLLEQLIDEIHDCQEAHLTARRKAVTPSERSNADIDVKSCVCERLNSIKSFNEDELPSEYLKRLWRAFDCQKS